MSYQEVLGAALQLTPEERSSLVEALERPQPVTEPNFNKSAASKSQQLDALAREYGPYVHEAWGDDVQGEIDRVRQTMFNRGTASQNHD